jgi:translation initiation factor IF-3
LPPQRSRSGVRAGTNEGVAGKGIVANSDVTARTVRLVWEGGHELVGRADALARAKAAGMDLVLVDATASPPVCRLLDAEALRQAERNREKAARRKAVVRRQLDVTKEFRLSVRTATNDVKVKASHAAHALEEGHKAKLAVVFRTPREAAESGNRQAAFDLLAQLRAAVTDAAGGEAMVREDAPAKAEPLSVWCRIAPPQKKKEGG